MADVAMPVSSIKNPQDKFEDQLKALQFSVQNLSLMELQFLAGENIEIPKNTLDQWLESLSHQRALVSELQNRYLGLEKTIKYKLQAED